MRKVFFIAVLTVVGASFANAQDYAKGELAAGWNYLHVDGGPGGTQNGLPGGFFVNGTYYFAKVLGLTGDFEYNKKTFSTDANFVAGDQGRVLSFHAGPQVKTRMGRFEPFAHALFGVTNAQFTPAGGSSLSDNAFSMKIGGGLDVAMVRHVALRVGEFNYYLTTFGANSNVNFNAADHQNNFTFGVGVVLR